ncbi:hypothetical protein [Leptospira phage LE4]|uniref:Uncharacterized protein n=1 Tax=Leptospira phage LE4 TaxID=2041383 RepID=A0A343LED6_9CAUD|nr:hypothetical protein HWB34_gp33 [Leptospira phage LE4]ATN95046.1 hypothetical protein [Leptospira phage LE4]
MIIPRKSKFGNQVEIKKPDTETILKVFSRSQGGKYATALCTLLEGSIESFEGASIDLPTLKALPLVSAEFIAIKAFELYDLPTKLEGVYQCPRCDFQIIHEEKSDYDNRPDLKEFEIIFDNPEESYESEFFKLVLDEENQVVIRVKKSKNDEEETEVATLSEFTFSDITLGTMMEIENDTTLKDSSAHLKKAYYKHLVDVNGSTTEDIDLDSLKARYGYMIMNFPEVGDFFAISEGMRRFGLQPYVPMCCSNCKKEWEQTVDFASFFVYALRSSQSKNKGKSIGTKTRIR